MPLHKVLSSDYDFHIPDYQRPYAWQQEQAAQLLTDLLEALDRSTHEPYFLGSIVLVKEAGNPESDVIDGQQRLTTLTILLSVLRDLTLDAELCSDLDRLVMEPGAKIRGLDPRPRLTMRSRDADFFEKYVQTKGRWARCWRSVKASCGLMRRRRCSATRRSCIATSPRCPRNAGWHWLRCSQTGHSLWSSAPPTSKVRTGSSAS